MSRRFIVLASIFQILLLWTSSATTAADVAQDCHGSAVCQQSRQVLIDPSLASVAGRTDFQAFASATRDDTSATIEVGSKTKDNAPATGWSFKQALKLSGPIGKNDSEADLATLEGLQDNVKLAYSASIRQHDADVVFRNTTKEEYNAALCRAHQLETLPGKSAPLIAPAFDCTKGELPDDAELYLDDLRAEGLRSLLDALDLGHGSFIYGVEATYAAEKKYDFITTESLTKQSEKHDGISLGAELGWLPYRWGIFFVGLSYRYEEGYKAQPEQDICAPFGEDLGALSCSKAAVGAPSKSKKQIASIELRRYFRGGSLAVNPRFSYDFENDVSGVRLPIYFLKDGKGALNGGLAAGWRSDTEDYTLSLFVGTMKNPFK